MDIGKHDYSLMMMGGVSKIKKIPDQFICFVADSGIPVDPGERGGTI
jgi:hypothetical protein